MIKTVGWIMLICILLLSSCLIIKSCNLAGNMIDNGIKTTYEQFKPEELLRKYEWFKDASSQLDQKISTLNVYQDRFTSLKTEYAQDSLKRTKWSKEDKEQWNIWQSEYLGIKASYNDLASTYNSQMSKFNWRFCNKGDLPQGATEVLPREFKPYLN